MPNPLLILEAQGLAALIAAAVLLLCSWTWRSPAGVSASVGSVLGVGLGLYAGCWWLGLRPQWPPTVGLDRLAFILLPAVLGVEMLAAFLVRWRWLIWLLRLAVAGSASRVLLHGSTYLADPDAPFSQAWTAGQKGLILAGLATALAGVWLVLALLVRPTPGERPCRARDCSVLLALAITCAGAGVTLLVSKYLGDGPIGFILAASLTGAMLASLVLREPPNMEGVVGVGVVVLFALLVLGHFFAELETSNAVLLFGAPLLCWLPELPYLRRLRPWLGGALRAGLTSIPVALAVTAAWQSYFVDEVAPDAPNPSQPANFSEPSLDDYQNYGK